MPFEKGRAKTGGRKPGATNKLTRDVQEFVDEIFSRVNPFDKLQDLLAAESEQVQHGVIKTLLEYRFGKPKESIELSGTLDLRDVITEARKRDEPNGNDGSAT